MSDFTSYCSTMCQTLHISQYYKFLKQLFNGVVTIIAPEQFSNKRG